MWPNPQESADLVIFTESILNEKLHFLCSVLMSRDTIIFLLQHLGFILNLQKCILGRCKYQTKWIFFSIWVFFHDHSRITGLQGKGEGISLTPHYHFHPLHRHLDISRAITAESLPLHIASSRTRTGNLWSLTTKLRANLKPTGSCTKMC